MAAAPLLVALVAMASIRPALPPRGQPDPLRAVLQTTHRQISDNSGQPTPSEIAAATREFDALVKRLGRIKTLSMYVVHGNFTDGGSRTVHFPPPRKPKVDDPKTILDCFNLWLTFHRVSQGKFRGQPTTVLEHIPSDGADGYGILYISKKTGWPLAGGFAPDRTTPRLTEFRHLRIKLKPAK
jgi:hypothetical protein